MLVSSLWLAQELQNPHADCVFPTQVIMSDILTTKLNSMSVQYTTMDEAKEGCITQQILDIQRCALIVEFQSKSDDSLIKVNSVGST